MAEVPFEEIPFATLVVGNQTFTYTFPDKKTLVCQEKPKSVAIALVLEELLSEVVEATMEVVQECISTKGSATDQVLLTPKRN